jgi:predicted component of type VI protein secretion system
MSPVRRRDLAVLAGGLAVAAWLLVRAWYGDLPPLRWWLPAPLAVLAVAEALGARTLRSRLAAQREARAGRGPRAADGRGAPVRPVEPMLVARLAVLAQASAYVGAVFAGIWGGVLLYAAPAVGRLEAAGGDTVSALIGVACSAALVAAALWLESVCKVPPDRDDDGALAA